jgi:hypothetical protein
MRTKTLLGSAGLGAGLMYLLDPERGRRRRALLRDKGVSAWRFSERAVSKTSRDVGNRAQGLAASAKGLFLRPRISEDVLGARVRSHIGHLVSHPHAIEVGVHRGLVTLSGPILKRELDDLIAGIKGIEGVAGVDNRLEPHKQAEGVPGLQGGSGRRQKRRFGLLRSGWSPAGRLLAGFTGAALAAYGRKRRGAIGALTGALGAGLVARSVAPRRGSRTASASTAW